MVEHHLHQDEDLGSNPYTAPISYKEIRMIKIGIGFIIGFILSPLLLFTYIGKKTDIWW